MYRRNVDDHMEWYLNKIGAYDKKPWERSVDERLYQAIHGLQGFPKKSGKVKAELIDVDLVRGSPFTKAKPQISWINLSVRGLWRLVLSPLHQKWWSRHTSFKFWLLMQVLYLSHILSVCVYLLDETGREPLVRLSHIVIPLILWLVLALLHSQIVSTHFDESQTEQRKKVTVKKRRKKTSYTKVNFIDRDSEGLLRRECEGGLLRGEGREGEGADRVGGKPVSESSPFPSSEESDDDKQSSDCQTRQTRQLSGESAVWNQTDSVETVRPLESESKQRNDSAVEADRSPAENRRRAESAAVRRRRRVKPSESKQSLDRRFSCVSSCDSEADQTLAGNSIGSTSECEWDRVNSDLVTSDTSYCLSEASDSQRNDGGHDDPFTWTQPSATLHNSHTPANDRVSCYIWENDECKKVDLTVLEIGATIIRRVENIPSSPEYLHLGIFFTLISASLPIFHHLFTHQNQVNFLYIIGLFRGLNWQSLILNVNGIVQRFHLAFLFFFLLSVAERTFRRRLWYAKHFCHLTSSRRARKYDLPHFRLKKVRNIRTWLSLRSYLKKCGPQRSIDVIVSTAFLLAVTLVALMCFLLLKDSEAFLESILNWELMCWCLALGIFLLRFMTLGTKINKKYRNFSVLITEQINLYLHMEQKPHKKEDLMLTNNVLKLAEDLLKELESPFKISGLSADSFLYNATKVIILSAFSAVLTELLGFKLKLYKIKIKT